MNIHRYLKMVETVKRKVTPKYTIKVDFEVIVCVIHFYKSIQQNHPNSFFIYDLYRRVLACTT